MVSIADILNAGILIVDDLEANVLLLEQMLRNVGYVHITSTMDPYSVSALHRLSNLGTNIPVSIVGAIPCGRPSWDRQ